jgi:hypothetical protein
MAITEDYPGLKVELLVDEKPLTENDDDNTDDKFSDSSIGTDSVTKYVEATTGANFAIQYCCSREFSRRYDLDLRVYIEGKFATGTIHFLAGKIR